MGANLVTQVLAHWTHVSDRAFRVLVRMAVTALDKPSKGTPAAVYHGGRELLAMTLRNQEWSERTKYRKVQEALAELSKAGAIHHVQSGWAGQRAVYRLTLGPSHATGSMDATTRHPVDATTRHPMGARKPPEWMPPGGTPRNQEEPLDERGEEEVAEVETTSHPPRASGADVIPLFGDQPKRAPRVPLKDRLDAIISRTESS